MLFFAPNGVRDAIVPLIKCNSDDTDYMIHSKQEKERRLIQIKTQLPSEIDAPLKLQINLI